MINVLCIMIEPIWLAWSVHYIWLSNCLFRNEKELVGWLGAAGRLSGTESATVLEATIWDSWNHFPLIHMLNSKRNVQPHPLSLAISGSAMAVPAIPPEPPCILKVSFTLMTLVDPVSVFLSCIPVTSRLSQHSKSIAIPCTASILCLFCFQLTRGYHNVS